MNILKNKQNVSTDSNFSNRKSQLISKSRYHQLRTETENPLIIGKLFSTNAYQTTAKIKKTLKLQQLRWLAREWPETRRLGTGKASRNGRYVINDRSIDRRWSILLSSAEWFVRNVDCVQVLSSFSSRKSIVVENIDVWRLAAVRGCLKFRLIRLKFFQFVLVLVVYIFFNFYTFFLQMFLQLCFFCANV